MGEVLAYSTTLSAAQRQAVEAYLENKWLGLYVTVPGYAGSNVLPVSTPLSIAGGATLDLYGGSQQVASLSDVIPGQGGTITSSLAGSASLTVTNGGSFSGTIEDGLDSPVSLVLTGGDLTLAGTNTYSGGTLVSSGTLTLNDNEALAPGSSLTVGNASAFPATLLAHDTTTMAVPEPGTLALLIAGLVVGLGIRQWRKRS